MFLGMAKLSVWNGRQLEVFSSFWAYSRISTTIFLWHMEHVHQQPVSITWE
jgi:hypothetical protein